MVDTLGLLLAVTVTAAAADDGTAAPQVLKKLDQESFPRLRKLWADNKYNNRSLDEWVSNHGWYVIEVKSRPPGSEGFQVIKWRWVVERTFAWLGRCRIHSRDYERKTESSEAQLQISMVQLMLRRLAGEKHKAPFHYLRPTRKTAGQLPERCWSLLLSGGRSVCLSALWKVGADAATALLMRRFYAAC